MSALRATVLADLPTPFQNAFFDAVATRGEVDLEVFFCRRSAPNTPYVGDFPKAVRWRLFGCDGSGSSIASIRAVPAVLLRPERVVFVLGYYLPALAAAAMALGSLNRCWVFWTDTIPPQSPSKGVVRTLRNRMLDFCLRRSTLCLTTGQAGRTSLIEHGVPVERAFALPFAIDVEGMQRDVASARQRRAEIRLELGVGPRDTLFLFVGRMVPNKAPDLFVAAAGRCATENAAARFAMVGGGALEQKVGDQVRSLGLTDRLVTLGARPPGALPDFWAAADFYVLPSRFDPWPVVLLDAMAAGVPVIGSEGCGSVRDVLVDGQQGWKVPADDVDALSRAMIHAAQTSPKQRSVLSEDAARTAARFDARVVAGEFTAVVEAALQKVRTTAD